MLKQKIFQTTMKAIKIAITIGLIITGICACKKTETTPGTDYSVTGPKYQSLDTLERQYSSLNNCIYNVMKSWYLWNDKTPTVDYNNSKYNDPNVLLNDMKYQALDRYSFILDASTSSAFFEGGQNGDKGIDFALEDEYAIKVSFVYPNSPAANAGIYRGMKMTKINSKDALSAFNDQSIYTDLQQSTISFEFEDTLGKTNTYSVSNGVYTIKTVPVKKIIIQNGRKIGYLVFTSFIGTAKQELDDAFTYFQDNGIDELVLDLRYNGGGYVYIANQLAAEIGGDKVKNKVFAKYTFNAELNKQLSTEAKTEMFNAVTSKLNIKRVFIIMSKNTASASELVINGLKPYMDVKTIGYYSYGKPVGFPGYGYKDKVIYAVTFSTVNAWGEGDYYHGIIPDKLSRDGLRYPLGDVRENRLADALFYIKNENFNTSLARSEEVTGKFFEKKGLNAVSGTY